MTCIVAATDGKRVVMGGDSAGIAGYGLTVRADSKVFRKGSYVIGFTSSFRMGQILRYVVDLPEPSGDLEAFMVAHFVPAVRAAFRDGGFNLRDKERDEGGTFLVGVAGQIFNVGDDYQVGRSVFPFDACGCACAVAQGACHVLHTLPVQPREIVTRALEAAYAFSAGVRPPFAFVETSS